MLVRDEEGRPDTFKAQPHNLAVLESYLLLPIRQLSSDIRQPSTFCPAGFCTSLYSQGLAALRSNIFSSERQNTSAAHVSPQTLPCYMSKRQPEHRAWAECRGQAGCSHHCNCSLGLLYQLPHGHCKRDCFSLQAPSWAKVSEEDLGLGQETRALSYASCDQTIKWWGRWQFSPCCSWLLL